MILVPDIHGRDFWKVVKSYKDNTIVFLGDYLDPYINEFPEISKSPYMQEEYIEKITALLRASIDNFKEILEFKRQNPNNVILLIGNHDAGYMYSDTICDCRQDRKNYDEIQSLFRENKDLFQLAYEHETDDGIRYIITHAGIRKDWIDTIVAYIYAEHINGNIEITSKNVVNILNEMYDKLDYYTMSDMLNHISFYRNGYEQYSSCVWTDYREFNGIDKEYDDIQQIFGHNKLVEVGKKLEFSNLHCIDSKKCFILNKEGLTTL